MTSASATQVVRRSAIEAAHAALGAQWISDHVHWPAGYGADPAAQATAVAAGAGVAEIGPFDELLLRGPGAVAAGARVAPASATTSLLRAVGADLRGERLVAWFLGPDEVLLVAPAGRIGLVTLADEVASDDVSAIDMTGARTTLRLVGPAAPALLAELCPADTTPATLQLDEVVQAPLAGVRASIARHDRGPLTGYTIMIARDEAAYVWDSIRRLGDGHGLVPVSPAAVAAEGTR